MEQGAGYLVQGMLPPRMTAGAGTVMETHFGEEHEEEATFKHSRCKLGFQGLAQKTHPNQLQRSWSSHGMGLEDAFDL